MKKLLLILLLFGLETKAQINYCDDVNYTTTSIGGNLILQGSTQIQGIVDWTWLVCNTSLCYSDTGQLATFNQINSLDTLKVCYDVIININGLVYYCTGCDTLVFDMNQYNWVLLTNSPLSINEMKDTFNDNKIFDLLGRELFAIPNRRIYIKNGKKYITNGRKL
jgi:hypothetical protein